VRHTVHCFRYGQEYKEHFDTLEDALVFAAQDYDHWVDKIVDEEGKVVVELKGFTAVFPSEETGKKCRFCGEPIEVKAFPITLAGGKRIIGYVCWTCLGAVYRGEEDE